MDRSLVNLRTRPTGAPALPSGSEKTAKGISVSPEVLKAERARATLPRTPDHAGRYDSATCAITADTKAFMLLLPDGTVLDLDEGGNTLAFEAFQAMPEGQAILNGKIGGLKPQASVRGTRTGDRVRVKSVELAMAPGHNPTYK
jgi:hypothetical protein